MLPLCTRLLQCYFTFFARHHTTLLPPRRLPLPPLRLFLPSVDICVSVSVPLSFTLFPLIPFPHTHTLAVLVLWAEYMCTEALETTFFFFFILGSHLAALYSNYPRRGLTAGNINRVARSYIEHTHLCRNGAHTHAKPTCSLQTPRRCSPVSRLFFKDTLLLLVVRQMLLSLWDCGVVKLKLLLFIPRCEHKACLTLKNPVEPQSLCSARLFDLLSRSGEAGCVSSVLVRHRSQLFLFLSQQIRRKSHTSADLKHAACTYCAHKPTSQTHTHAHTLVHSSLSFQS